MALTKTLVPDSADIWGKHRVETYDIALDTSYPTGGYSVAASDLGWSEITGALILGESGSTKGYHAVWDTANKKLMMFRSAGVTPAGTVAAPTFTGNAIQPAFTVKTGTIGANMNIGLTADAATASVVGGTGITADRSLTTNNPVGTVTATGTNSAPAFTGTAVAAAGLVQVSNAVNLSAVTVRVNFIGI